MIYGIRQKDWYIDTKSDDKEFMQFKSWKNLSLITGVLGVREEVG